MRDRSDNIGVARSAGLLAFSRGILLAFGVVSNYLAARVLGPEGRGELAAALQLGYLLGFFVALGLDRGLPVVAAGVPMDRALQTAQTLVRRRSGTVLALGIGVSLLSFLENIPEYFLFAGLVGLVAVSNSQIKIFEAAAINEDRPNLMTLLQAWSGASTLALVAILSVASIRESLVWTGAYALSITATPLVFVYRYGRGAHDAELATNWSASGRRLLPASLASFASLRMDRVLLLVLHSSKELGLYVVAATLVDLASVPIEMLANVLLPRWRKQALTGELRAQFQLQIGATLALVLSLAVWMVGTVAIVPIFGDAYTRSRDFLAALSIAAVLLGWDRLAQSRALAVGFDRLVSVSQTAGLVVGGVAYIALIPRYGGVGAAIGSCIGYGGSLLALVIGFGRKSTNEEPSAKPAR